MNENEYQQLELLEKTYWWHIGRKDIIKKQLHKYFGNNRRIKILNIGCGTGGIIGLLEEFGEVKNIDVSKTAVDIAKRNGYKNVFIYDGKNIPFKKHYFDIIIALDVLEHIEDDLSALKLWKKYLKPGGYLLLTVPAYQWLWSEHDEALHHYRRYLASDLHRTLNLVGFKAIKRTYAIILFFPVIVGYRLIKSVFPGEEGGNTSYVILPNLLNSILISILRLEARMLIYLSMPFGTSILFLAKSI